MISNICWPSLLRPVSTELSRSKYFERPKLACLSAPSSQREETTRACCQHFDISVYAETFQPIGLANDHFREFIAFQEPLTAISAKPFPKRRIPEKFDK